MNYFQCSKCKQSLSEDCFTPSQRRNGKWCKECYRKRDQLPEVKERKRLAKKRYREKNKNNLEYKEKNRLANQRYRKENKNNPEYKERKRLNEKRYYEKNKNNPEWKANKRDSMKKSKYKLTDEQFTALKAVEICQNPGCNNPATCIDHCHASLQVRGRLCNGCNASLGLLSEDPARITGLLEYLKAQ
jgi:hypothetical protein